MKIYGVLDIFTQNKQFKVSKTQSAQGSCVGSLFSIIVYTTTLMYIVLRSLVLVNKQGTILNQIVQYNAIPTDQPLRLTVGDKDFNF